MKYDMRTVSEDTKRVVEIEVKKFLQASSLSVHFKFYNIISRKTITLVFLKINEFNVLLTVL